MRYEQPGNGMGINLLIYSNALSLLKDGGITGYDHYTAVAVAYHVEVFGRWAAYLTWLNTVALNIPLSPLEELSLNRKMETCERGMSKAVGSINDIPHNKEPINIIEGIALDGLYASLVVRGGERSHAINWYAEELADEIGDYEIESAGAGWAITADSSENQIDAFGLVRGCQFLIYKLKNQLSIDENEPIKAAISRLVGTLARHYNTAANLSLSIAIDGDCNILADGDRVWNS